ncbi:MAG: hypothetical protein ACKOGN_04540, partial [Gammaproteobacteria bacterium]
MSRPLLSLACAAVAACALLITPDALAQSGKAKRIDLNTAEGATLAGRRIQCGAIDNTPTIYYFHGEGFARVPGERDRKLFDVEG